MFPSPHACVLIDSGRQARERGKGEGFFKCAGPAALKRQLLQMTIKGNVIQSEIPLAGSTEESPDVSWIV